jgi:hypothetical protein
MNQGILNYLSLRVQEKPYKAYFDSRPGVISTSIRTYKRTGREKEESRSDKLFIQLSNSTIH